jgi:pantoate--beta-alanine ligase
MAEGFAVDYVEARESDSLAPLVKNDPASIRMLAAARLGTTRLIDNVAV